MKKEGKYIPGRNKGAERHQLRYTAEQYNERLTRKRTKKISLQGGGKQYCLAAQCNIMDAEDINAPGGAEGRDDGGRAVAFINRQAEEFIKKRLSGCLLYTSPSPRD